ncbi:DUF6163 family protein [Microvirga sp. 17 mud 1-3]|uniref:DUF6163 family protein n=1 Tax=Microvirga sp. 17 mud 1-3 TaxID=2082949 RepID=UPI000D6BA03C|nr:DUF6163 family protein [Microvirga sp. 17 mud 1-3]AWM86962.1 hypothetical protein C4E04_09625 [Microvirga sp. 17 mud 1-3]
MPRSASQKGTLDLAKDHASDRIEERPASPAALRWGFVLTWYMRILAILWIMKGLSAWALILGIWTPGHFESRTTGYQATIIYFAIIDLIAAVGLWMGSSWGGIMWLLAVMSHLVLAAFFPSVVSSGLLTMAFFFALIAVYLGIAWLEAQEK